MYVLMNSTHALSWGILTPFVFIFSIYIKRPSGHLKDHPDEIKRRCWIVGITTLLWNILFYYLNSHEHLSSQGPGIMTWIGISFTFPNYLSVICALAMTNVLYAGSLVQVLFEDPPEIKRNLFSMKEYIMIPIFEETMYRSCLINCLISGGFGWSSVWISDFLYSLSLFYQIEDVINYKRRTSLQSLTPVLLQICLKTVFGLYAGYVFIVTGSLYSVIVVNSFTKFMGLPNFKFLEHTHPAHKYKNAIIFTYAAGVFIFATLQYLMMNPEFFNSWHAEFIKRRI